MKRALNVAQVERIAKTAVPDPQMLLEFFGGNFRGMVGQPVGFIFHDFKSRQAAYDREGPGADDDEEGPFGGAFASWDDYYSFIAGGL